MAKNIIIILIIIGAVLVGGSLYFVFFLRVPSFEEVTLASFKSWENVKTFHNDFTLEIKGWQQTEEEKSGEEEIQSPSSFYQPFSLFTASLKNALTQKPSFCKEHPEERVCKEESAYRFSATFKSDYDLKEENNPKIKNEISLNGSSKDFSFSGDFFFIIFGEEKSYFKLNDFDFNIVGTKEMERQSIDAYKKMIISPLKGEWILFDKKEIEGFSKELGYPIEQESKKIPSLTQEELEDIGELFPKAFEVKSSKIVKIGEEKAYHYKISPLKKGLKELLMEVTIILMRKFQEAGYVPMGEEFNEQEIRKDLSEGIEDFIQYLTFTEGEIWYRKDDSLPLKMVFNLGIKEKEEIFISGESSFSQFNQDIPIGEPKGAVSFLKVYEEIMKNFGMGVQIQAPSVEQRDSDGDGLTDLQESCLGTNPNKRDTDNDGYPDLKEIQNGYNPLKPSPGDKFSEAEKKRAAQCLSL